MVTTEEVHNNLGVIIQNQEDEALNYAVNYAKAGLDMTDWEMLTVQILYILNNTHYWRGKEARRVKATLRQYLAENRL